MDLNEALKETALPVRLCGVGQWLKDYELTTDDELEAAHARGLSVAHIHRAITKMGYPGADTVLKKHMGRDCACRRGSK